jgi:hypothetical protein
VILHTRTIREEAHHRVVVLIQLLGQQRPNFDKRTVCGQPARSQPAGVRLIKIIMKRFESFRYSSNVPVEAGATAGGETLQHCIVGARSQAADGFVCVKWVSCHARIVALLLPSSVNVLETLGTGAVEDDLAVHVGQLIRLC